MKNRSSELFVAVKQHFARIAGQRSFLLVGLLVVIVTIFSVTTSRFLTYPMFRVIMSQCAEIGLMGLGMSLAWMINGVDLTVNDAANLSALTAALVIQQYASQGQISSSSLFLSYCIALLTGGMCGIINGILIGYLDVPPILATLGGLSLYRGISVAVTGGKTLAGLPANVAVIGQGTVFQIPIPFVIFIIVSLLIFISLKYTVFGFQVKMVGINTKAAYFSGINYRKIIMIIYTLSGILAGLAGIIIMGRTRSVAYEYGTQVYIVFTLLITNLAGISAGEHSAIAVFMATLVLQILSTGFYLRFMTLPGGPFFNNFLWGLFLVTILVLAQLFKRARQ
jgi:simple sugar transport system permease protein